mgnify:CR=1 FL=1
MDPDVNLQSLAAACNGYVGADLEALCREAALSALRKSSDGDLGGKICNITVDDFKHARSIVGPSITRGVTVEIPKVSWEDIGGLYELKVCCCCTTFQVYNHKCKYLTSLLHKTEKASASC